jgi:hypothetical protein
MTTTILDNSANEFAAFSTILSGFDEEYVSPNRKSKSSFSLSSPTAKNVVENFSSPSPTTGRGRGRGGKGGYKNNYDPDEPLDVLREMNQMLEAAERSPTNNENYTKKARTFVREAYGTFEDSASRLERDLMEKKNRMKRDAAEESRRQLDKDSPEFSLDMLASGDRATILAREAEILRAEEESLRRVREGASRAAERERQRLESERVVHANGRANWVSAENKRRGMRANARASEQSATPVEQAQRGGGVGTVTPTRIVPKFTNGGDMEEDKENSGAMGSKRDKMTRPPSFFNPFKTITNVAVGAKNALLSRENPKQKPKVRRSIIAIDEPNENSMNATGPSAVVSSYKTPVQESKKRSTILTPVESRETNRGISSSYEEEDEGEEDATESDVMIAKMISPGQMVYIKKPIEKATDIAATNGAKQENEKTEKIKKKKKKNKRSLNVHPALLRVAKAASTIGASFVIVSAVGSYATGARDVRDLQRAARNVQKTTVSVAMFIGKTWKSISKNLIPGVTDEVPTLTPTVVYQRTPNKVVKKTVVLRPHQVGVQPGPSGEDFRRAYGRG